MYYSTSVLLKSVNCYMLLTLIKLIMYCVIYRCIVIHQRQYIDTSIYRIVATLTHTISQITQEAASMLYQHYQKSVTTGLPVCLLKMYGPSWDMTDVATTALTRKRGRVLSIENPLPVVAV